MKCPHCNKLIKDEHIDNCHANAENYGGNWFTLQCKKCKGFYSFYVGRYTRLDKDSVQKSDNNFTSF